MWFFSHLINAIWLSGINSPIACAIVSGLIPSLFSILCVLLTFYLTNKSHENEREQSDNINIKLEKQNEEIINNFKLFIGRLEILESNVVHSHKKNSDKNEENIIDPNVGNNNEKNKLSTGYVLGNDLI